VNMNVSIFPPNSRLKDAERSKALPLTLRPFMFRLSGWTDATSDLDVALFGDEILICAVIT